MITNIWEVPQYRYPYFCPTSLAEDCSAGPHHGANLMWHVQRNGGSKYSNIIKIKWLRLKMDLRIFPKRSSFFFGKMMEHEVLNSIHLWFLFLPPRPSRRISSSDDQVPIRHLTFTMFFVLPCVRALRQGTSPCLEDLLRFLSPAFLWPVIYMKRPSFTSSTCCKKSIKKW